MIGWPGVAARGTAAEGSSAGLERRHLPGAERQHIANSETGVNEMRNIFTACMVAAVWAAMSSATPAAAQEMSEAAVRTLMNYAWSLTPERFTKPDGVVVEVDPKSRATTEVPLDQARLVIKAGRLSAHAQTCDLKEEHAANYRSFMAREAEKKKWTEQQMLYMNQLHLVTVMLLTGKLKVVAADEGKAPEVLEDGNKTDVDAKSCTPEQREKVRQAIVKTLPMAPKAAAGGAAPPVAQPASAPAAAKK